MWLVAIVLDNAGLNEKFDLYVSEWTQRFSDQVLLLSCMLFFKMQLYPTPSVSLICTRVLGFNEFMLMMMTPECSSLKSGSK